MKISIVAKTDVGKERDVNEDAFMICPNLAYPNWSKESEFIELGMYGALLAIADGMGGAAAGEVASHLALDTVKKVFLSSNLDSIIGEEGKIKVFLQQVITEADNAIDEHSITHPETLGMGTTIVICWIIGGNAYIAWCGDSRCYVFNPSFGLRLLTKDHSYVQELIDRGELTTEAAIHHPDSNIITRGLGDFDSKSIADLVIYPIQVNDVFLLCSDGLTGYCYNETIERIMYSHHKTINSCCDELIKQALDAGGYDNICIALAKVFPESINENDGVNICYFGRLLSSLFRHNNRA